MGIENFLAKFREQLLDEQDISINTKFREIASWDSLTAMAVTAMIEDEYNVTISDKEMRSFSTIQEIYDLIQVKLK